MRLRSVAWTPLACLLVHGCTDVHGGAVELSWKLRSESGAITDFLECNQVPVAAIELDWQVGDVAKSQSWSCGLGHAVTGFDLPPGQALLFVKPVCPPEVPLVDSTYIAPPPIERQVAVGDTISLGAVVLVLQVSDCNASICGFKPANCQ